MSTLCLSISRCRQTGPKRVPRLLFDLPRINNLPLNYISKDWTGRTEHAWCIYLAINLCVVTASTFTAQFMWREKQETNIYQASHYNWIVIALWKTSRNLHRSSFIDWVHLKNTKRDQLNQNIYRNRHCINSFCTRSLFSVFLFIYARCVNMKHTCHIPTKGSLTQQCTHSECNLVRWVS